MDDGLIAVTLNYEPAPGEDAAGLQFDLRYDSSQFELFEAVTGDAAVAAGKDTVFSEPYDGVARVMTVGFNQDGIGDGNVTTLYFSPTGGQTTSQLNPMMENLVGSGPYGESLQLFLEDATISAAKAQQLADDFEGASDIAEAASPNDGGNISSFSSLLDNLRENAEQDSGMPSESSGNEVVGTGASGGFDRRVAYAAGILPESISNGTALPGESLVARPSGQSRQKPNTTQLLERHEGNETAGHVQSDPTRMLAMNSPSFASPLMASYGGERSPEVHSANSSKGGSRTAPIERLTTLFFSFSIFALLLGTRRFFFPGG